MSTPAKWLPGDDELDAMARTLPASEPESDRAEHNRTSLLASAASVAQRSRRSVSPIVIGVTAVVAAAAAILLWFGTRSQEHAPKEKLAALGSASFEPVSGWPDFVVALDEGRLSVVVATLESSERFRVKTRDAEVEVRGTRFVVAAHDGSLQSVSVTEGSVELRKGGQPTVFLAAGQMWSVQTTQRDELAPAIAPVAPEVSKTAAVTTTKQQTTQQATTRTVGMSDSGSSTTVRASQAATSSTATERVPVDATRPPPSSPPAPALAAKPGELEFRNGVAALRAGDATRATNAFAAACAAAQADALGEDACFWVGAAAKRAGDTKAARVALTRYMQRFPSSTRAGEAAALLGWILYDVGELAAAESKFRAAANDRVPKVKDSAERGLKAIARKRGSTL